MAGAAGDQRERRLAVNPRPGFGGVGDAGFVPHVENAYAAAGGGGQHFIQVIPHQREDGFDAQPRRRFDK